ncbi:arrestin domain-containing protein 3-like [Thalassophryne amazonica]|uniref:arrestin domain-containing protein 3-like n=1 Tax=Thalassophryne amazonica TaxID=390379 RepID=UPI0014708CB2|nr:arrestin domain-containing protein 3-like [Thalassophryne amazonica]
MTIQSISVEYDARNEDNVFFKGDTVTGRIVLEVAKETKIECLSVKAKGKAVVSWTEHYGPNLHITYSSKEKFFSIKKTILQNPRGGSEILTPGRHVHPFSFEIPLMDLPSTFKGKHGKIKYFIEARVSRSMMLDSKAKTNFTVLSKDEVSIPNVMIPQQRNIEKHFVLFASGNVTLNVTTEKMGYLQGESLKVKAEIINNSTHTVTPKFILYEKQCFYAEKRRKIYTKDILKEKGECVSAQTQQNVTKILTIPPDLPGTIFNCPNIQLEYRLKVILHVSFCRKCEVRLPIVVLTTHTRSQSEDLQEKQNKSWFRFS